MAQFDELPKQFMKLALQQAQEALDATEVPVGCVFVLDNLIIGAGRNRTNMAVDATRHAELVAVDDMLGVTDFYQTEFTRSSLDITERLQKLKDSTLYVTVEPCIMCASALRQLGIKKVVYGASNERFGGCGSTERYSVESGVFRDEAVVLLRKFYVRENERAPIPKKKNNRILKTEDLSDLKESNLLTKNEN
ncbi:tRNA(adenine34) deaminase [Nowakowskiella sp. JEL0078]|nr:tRNA(adenine34) deaminase [Nowakowskiella sp. JEL0078]